uniref:Uncharacterized protein n=1 Tax=Meloidogyne enterolobii TaxID=390850 RepID=A0A6V7XL07_MELEN|nr:unnamed protein product [Meloidogyne enterolobii]
MPEIIVEGFEIARLHDLILEYIITSKDCSNIVPKIVLLSSYFPDFKLNERAENVEIKQVETEKHTKYQIANIYNPKVRFEFCTKKNKEGGNFCHTVEIMEKN